MERPSFPSSLSCKCAPFFVLVHRLHLAAPFWHKVQTVSSLIQGLWVRCLISPSPCQGSTYDHQHRKHCLGVVHCPALVPHLSPLESSEQIKLCRCPIPSNAPPLRVNHLTTTPLEHIFILKGESHCSHVLCNDIILVFMMPWETAQLMYLCFYIIVLDPYLRAERKLWKGPPNCIFHWCYSHHVL